MNNFNYQGGGVLESTGLNPPQYQPAGESGIAQFLNQMKYAPQTVPPEMIRNMSMYYRQLLNQYLDRRAQSQMQVPDVAPPPAQEQYQGGVGSILNRSQQIQRILDGGQQ